MASPQPDVFWDPYRGPDENSAPQHLTPFLFVSG
jgi:hypothetical protein